MGKRKVRASKRRSLRTLILASIALLALIILLYFYTQNANTVGGQGLTILVNGQTYTFRVNLGARLEYKWYQVMVFPNGTRIPFGRVNNGTFTYTIVNVSTRRVFKTEEIPIWFEVKVTRNGMESQGLTKVYFTSIALPIELLGKPILNMTPVKEEIRYHGGIEKVWAYKGKLEPRSPECYEFEDEYYYSVSTGLLLVEKTKCYPPPASGYPNGTYVLYYKELVSVRG